MAINTTTRQTTAFTSGNNFAFAFKVYEVGDVKVIQIQTSNGAETVLTITTHYTVTLNDDQDANPGGTVTLVSSGSPQNLASGYNIVITSKVSALQQTEITNQGGFFPEVINDVLDKAVILSQQQQNILDQTIRFPLTQSVSGLEITENAADRANKSLRFDSSGDLELYSPASVVQFTQTEKDKLAAIEANSTADQTNAEIKTAYEANSDTNAFTDAEKTKLSGVEASADVTDATNVNAAGAIMNSDLDGKGELLVGDGSGDPSALSVGTNGYVLKANSSTATGLEWAAESGGTDLTSGGTIDGDLTLTGANYNAVWDKSDNALEFADEAKASFGNDGDLQIYHQTSGNHSIIKETGSGSLIIQAENFDVQDTSGNSVLVGFHDGGVRLSHHGDKRLETTSTGITVYSGAAGSEASTGAITSGNIGVTGNITVSGTVDGRDVATDGTKLDGIEASADVTDATNVNAAGAVMNSDLDGKGELLVGDGSGDPTALAAGTNGYVLKANSSTATGLEWAAESSGGGSGEANQNAFSTIAVSGQSNVAADSTTDTLNIAAGSNVTITTNATSDTVTIASTDTNTTYSVGDGGLTQNNFTDALKTKLDGIEASADVTDATNVASAGAVMDSDFASNGFMKRTGAGSYTVDTNTYLTAVPSGYLQNVSEDSSPQLGANLDVQANEITTSTSNGNIKLNPNGTGVVEVKGDGSSADGTIQLNCSQNSHGVKIKSPPHSANATYTLTLPNDDGDANQVLKTDGSGGLDWVDQPTANATHTGEVTGSTALTIADNVVDEANLKVSNSPTDGYVLTAQSGNTGGLTWAAQSGGGGGGLTSDSQYNTVGGTNAGDSFSGTSAEKNTLIGYNAGTAITTGDQNTSVGYEALKTAETSSQNTAIGYQCLQDLTGGSLNTCIGKDAGKDVTSGSYSVYVGATCGHNMTTQDHNTGVGYGALGNATGSNNVAVGRSAGGLFSSATYCTAIGPYAGANESMMGSTNCTLIGYNAERSAAFVDDEITLGDSDIATLRCNVQTISSLSDRRDKTDINTLDLGLDFVKSLNPVKFKWKTRDGNGKDGSYEAGFIAQDFQQLQKDNDADYLKLVMDSNPDRLEASYGKLIPVLVKAIQELTIEVETLKSNV